MTAFENEGKNSTAFENEGKNTKPGQFDIGTFDNTKFDTEPAESADTNYENEEKNN